MIPGWLHETNLPHGIIDIAHYVLFILDINKHRGLTAKDMTMYFHAIEG